MVWTSGEDGRIGIQVLYSGVLWPHTAWVTRLHHRWGAIEAEIFIFKFLPWPGFQPQTSQSNGRERYHSTMTHTQNEGIARGWQKIIPQRGTNNIERPRLDHICPSPENKEVPSIQREKRT